MVNLSSTLCGKNTRWGQNRLFDKWCWENWVSPCGRINRILTLYHYAKINPKLSRDLTIKTEIVKILEGNMGQKLFDISLVNDILVITPETQAL